MASLGVSDATLPALVDRTRDVADDVRRTTFRTLADKVPLAALSIAQRTTVLRRGLADRAPPVREAAIGMLDKWMQGAPRCYALHVPHLADTARHAQPAMGTWSACWAPWTWRTARRVGSRPRVLHRCPPQLGLTCGPSRPRICSRCLRSC